MITNPNITAIRKRIIEEKRQTLAKRLDIDVSELLTSQELADLLKISRMTVYNLRSKRVIKPRRHRGVVFYIRKEIENWISNK